MFMESIVRSRSNEQPLGLLVGLGELGLPALHFGDVGADRDRAAIVGAHLAMQHGAAVLELEQGLRAGRVAAAVEQRLAPLRRASVLQVPEIALDALRRSVRRRSRRGG